MRGNKLIAFFLLSRSAYFIAASIIFLLAVFNVSAQEIGQTTNQVAWVNLLSGVTNDLNSIACADERTCYVVGGAPFIGGNGIILKTANGGDSWARQTIPTVNPLRGISCPTSSVCYAAGDGGALLKTINSGGAWTLLGRNTPASEQYYWDIAAYDVSNATAVGNAGTAFRTTNGGATWNRVSVNTDENLLNAHFANAAIGWIVGTGGKVLKTINGGATWSPLDVPPGMNGLFDIFSRDGLKTWVGGDVGRILKSANGGLDWTLLRPDTFSTFRAVEFINDTEGFIAGSVIKRTTDGGTSWSDEEIGANVILRDLVCLSSSVCYAVGDDGVILRRGAAGTALGTSSNFTSRVTGAIRRLFGIAQAPEQEPESESRQGISPRVISRVAGAIGRVFEDNLNAEQKRIAESSSKRNIATKKIRGISLNPNILNQNRLLFNFFPDKELTIEIKQRQEKSGGIKIFRGNLEGKPESKITLVSKGNVTVGNFHTEEGIYEIRYAGAGTHIVRFIDPKLFPNEKHSKIPPPPREGIVTAAYAPPPPSEVADAVVDVALIITPDAYEGMGGDQDAAEAFIELMIDEANQAYDLSDIGMRLNLVRWAAINDVIYNDSGDLDTDLDRLSDPISSPFNRLGSFADHERDEYDADLVSLLVQDGGRFCGLAWIMNEANESRFGDISYSVVDVDCVSNYTFIHELGHNMGLEHDRNNDNENGAPRYSYAYGYQDPQERFRTIMAYDCEDGPCQRVPFFSNPNFNYQGIPFGTVAENNARALRNSRFVVANYSETRGGGSSGRNSSDAAADFQDKVGAKAFLSPPSGIRLLFRNTNRAIQSLLTFDERKKAELGLKFANENLLETQQLSASGNERAAASQLEKFSKNLDKAEAIAESLSEKNKDEAAKLRKNLLDNQLHQQNFLRAIQKEFTAESKEKIRDIREKEINRVARTAESISPTELKKVFDKAEPSMLPTLERVENKLSAPVKKIIGETHKKLSEEKSAAKEPAALQSSKPFTICSRDIENLVCGVNGLTYLNICFAEEANVKIAYEGKCKESSEKSAILCAADYKPVCGSDGKTYSNECVATEQNKVKIVYEGECKIVKDHGQMISLCSKDKDLVCGENGITYLNSCFAKDARVSIVYKGACEEKESARPIPIEVCPKTEEYVCGVNNLTYLNNCFAKQANAGVAYEGFCKEVKTSKPIESVIKPVEPVVVPAEPVKISPPIPVTPVAAPKATISAPVILAYPMSAEINIKASVFSPLTATVAPGAKLVFTNFDKIVHNVRGDISSPSDLKLGGTTTIVAPLEPGAYSYYCGYHPSMKGAIIVK